jgi:uracil-DNA glycosylase
VVVLGAFGWQALLPALIHWKIPAPRPKFGHAKEVLLSSVDGGPDLRLLGCYHPSQRNVSTGRVTQAMLGAVLTTAATS